MNILNKMVAKRYSDINKSTFEGRIYACATFNNMSLSLEVKFIFRGYLEMYYLPLLYNTYRIFGDKPSQQRWVCSVTGDPRPMTSLVEFIILPQLTPTPITEVGVEDTPCSGVRFNARRVSRDPHPR